MSPSIPSDSDSLLEEACERIFGDHTRAEAHQEAEESGWAPSLWNALEGAGLTALGIPEVLGGSGGGIDDIVAVLRLAGRFAAPLPLAESSGLVGGWLVSELGLPVPPGPLSAPIPRAADRLTLAGSRVSGDLHRVPWGARSGAVAAIAMARTGPVAVLLDPSRALVRPGRNLAGEPRDHLTFDAVSIPHDHQAALGPRATDEFALRGALSRVLLMAGALETTAQLTIDYSNERQQFGRPIGRFQAVAQRLAQMACETEAAGLAAAVAARRFDAVGSDAAFEVAAAKITAARAATAVTAAAHQVHGAIGMSLEYRLHHFSRRLWAWRQEWGSETYWAERLGRIVVDAGSDALWPCVTRASASDERKAG